MAAVEGYAAEPAEVQAVWDALVGDRGDREDDMPRWAHLSSRLALLDAVAEKVSAERAAIAAGWNANGVGDSYATIGDRVGLSRSRAQKLVEKGRAAKLSRRSSDSQEGAV